MILVRQIRIPEQLQANQTRWMVRWCDLRPGEWATRTAKKLLKRHLSFKSHDKCVYCESILGASAKPEIEHYHAKTIRPELAFDWENLFLACGHCNNTKLDRAHDGKLLKPDVDDGETHFWFNADTGELEPLPGSDIDRGESTRRLCDLNRNGLRRERIKQHRLALAPLEAIEENRTLPRRLRTIFVRLLSPEAEYKLAIRAALPKRLADIDRRMYHAAD